ncbi:MAG: Crotonobetainyl-CoA dehydrogenase [Phycisphaerae bacterium]|nr:Crotonobetainyl-CoA dehydrogenase [Phycisphaerae bacterium]
MANYFSDNEDLQFLFNHLDLAKVATVQEDNFHPSNSPTAILYAPTDAADAIDNYRRVLEITGQVAGEHIAPRAETVDLKGHHLNSDGTVTLSDAVRDNLQVLAQTDLMGFTLPRRYGGLNCPNVIYTMAVEMISRADGSLMNLFGLQGIAETINAFASPEIKRDYLPRFSRGEVTGAMVLTEPDAGSDLQAVSLRAWQDNDGTWRLNGVKRFITNGCGDILLTLARSEPDIKDGRGLSLFLAERGPRIKVRHLEEKLGIHGSPTCELVYDDAPAKLIGERQLGLISYVMSLMNGARVGVAAQAVGIAEAAFRVARQYAHSRKQFGKAIEHLPAVAEMLVDMKINLEAARALLYETCIVCDLENNNLRVLEEQNTTLSEEEKKRRKNEARGWKRLNGMLTPMSKYYCSEMSIRLTSDAIQVLGGSGYMTDYPVERYYRDARITSIYEGTSQLQIVAAVRGVCSGAFEKRVEEYEQHPFSEAPIQKLHQTLVEGKRLVIEAIEFVKGRGGTYMDLYGRKLVDSALVVLIGHLLLRQAETNERKKQVARRFIETGWPTLQRDIALIRSGDTSPLEQLTTLAGPPPGVN